jgi:hypothetical protein
VTTVLDASLVPIVIPAPRIWWPSACYARADSDPHQQHAAKQANTSPRR